MKKSKVGVVALSAVMAASCFAGCKQEEVANDDKTLQIYCIEAGYGVDWLYAVADAFKAEFPEYTVAIETEQGVNRVENMLTAGPEHTTHDLLFTSEKLAKLQASGANALAGYDCVMENLTDMYNTTIPGENKTLKEKTDEYILNLYAVEEENEEGVWEDNYYMYSWSNSLMGIVYNKTLFAEKSVNVPRTTEELYEVCDVLKKDVAPMLGSFNVSYTGAVATAWWAQYEGRTDYERYWNPTSLSDYDTVSQKGKLYQVQIQNQLYKPEYNRLHTGTLDLNYTEAQAKFITREAAMLFCGDWFENEMKTIIAQNQAQGNNDEYAMMKTPLNSAIVERLSFWNKADDYSTIFQAARVSGDAAKLQTLKDADAKLLQIIDYVDGKTTEKPSFATDEDIAIVRESRNVAITYGAGHQAAIPAYATAKEAAKKFLLYLASDRAQKIVAENCSGSVMPYGYDPREDNVTVTNFASSALDIVQDAVICSHSSVTRGEWLIGLAGLRLSSKRFASTTDYITPEYVYEDSIISFDEYQRLLSTAGII